MRFGPRKLIPFVFSPSLSLYAAPEAIMWQLYISSVHSARLWIMCADKYDKRIVRKTITYAEIQKALARCGNSIEVSVNNSCNTATFYRNQLQFAHSVHPILGRTCEKNSSVIYGWLVNNM